VSVEGPGTTSPGSNYCRLHICCRLNRPSCLLRHNTNRDLHFGAHKLICLSDDMLMKFMEILVSQSGSCPVRSFDLARPGVV